LECGGRGDYDWEGLEGKHLEKYAQVTDSKKAGEDQV
jgi:hypothetical protein